MPAARSGSKHHHIRYDGGGMYEISWRVEMKYSGSRLLFHRTFARYTDEKGARRFSKKWNVSMPEPVSTPPTVGSAPKSRRR